MFLRKAGTYQANGRYIEDGLNPDKYTRRFVNMLMKDNQFVNGKIDAVQVCPGITVDHRISGMY
jgi:hypothetical protein